MRKKVTIVNYGLGNYGSIIGSLQKLNCAIDVSSSKKVLNNSDLLILPGVGTFPLAMNNLKKLNLIGVIKKLANEGVHILGICLGMHLLTHSSEEINFTKGLKLIPGKIDQLKSQSHNIGWGKINFFSKKSDFFTLNNNFFYFQHKYNYSGPGKYKTSTSKDLGNLVAIIEHKNLIGVQFHPEKSQLAGLNFFEILLKRI